MAILKEPVITLEGVTVRTLALSSLGLEVSLRVSNPNIFGVTLRELPFTVTCKTDGNEKQIAAGNTGGVKIRGNGDTVLTLPVTAHNAGIIHAVSSLVAEGGIDVTVRGTAVIDWLVACHPVPFTKSIRLTTRQLTDSLSAKVLKEK